MHEYVYILFMTAALSVLLSWIKSERIINPVSIFVLWWTGFIYLSTFRLINMRLPSERTYYYLLYVVAMFSLGGITFLRNSQKKNPNMRYLDKNYNISLKIRYFYYFQILCTAILLFYLSKSAVLLSTMNPGVYRNLLFSEFSIFGSFKPVITFVVEPSLYISALISLSGLLLKRIPRKHLLLSVLNLGLYSGVTVGRAPIFILIVCIFLAFIFSISEKLLKLKLNHILWFSVPVAFIIWLSLFRKKNYGIDAFLIIRDYFVWYLTGPFTAFELFLDNYKQGTDWDYSGIRGLFAGIEEIVKPLLSRIFTGFTPINDDFHSITKVYRSLGGKATGHNSHYTMLYTFMRDAGLYGILFFSYILGTVNAFLYNNFRNNKNINNYSLMTIVLYLSLIGITRWELRYSWAWLTIIGIILVSRKFVIKKEHTYA